MTHADPNVRPPPDALLVDIAEYVCSRPHFSDAAYDTARLALLDAIGCGILALNVDDCRRLLGPIVPGTRVPVGVHVPGTAFFEDPVKAAFDIGAMNRWLDFNDTWLAAEWGHPSDNFAAILSAAEYACHERPLCMRDVLTAGIQASEIQGILALENSFNRVGLDHVLLVRVASTAVATHLLGGTHAQVTDAVSNAFVDGGTLRTYRHAPNAGSRKSWAAGDAASRAVRLALLTLQGEMGYPSALSTPTWGFSDVLLRGKPLVVNRPFADYVMQNVLFKVSYPAEFHAQTAAEAAIALHPLVRDRLDEIDRIEIHTQESAVRIISKTGPLHNPADRDHCLQFIVAVGLLHGTLTAEHYERPLADDPRLDRLRSQMLVSDDPRYTADYADPAKRSIANRVQVFFTDTTWTPPVAVEYPLGHRRRRPEALPLVRAKLASNLVSRLPAPHTARILSLTEDVTAFLATPVRDFMALLSTPN